MIDVAIAQTIEWERWIPWSVFVTMGSAMYRLWAFLYFGAVMVFDLLRHRNGPCLMVGGEWLDGSVCRRLNTQLSARQN